MKRILNLTASFGSGHVTASKNLEKVIKEKYPHLFHVETYDFLKQDWVTGLDILYRRFYDRTMESPVLWDIIFKLTNFNIIARILSDNTVKTHKSVYDFLINKSPDVILTTHFVWNYFLEKIKKKINLKAVCIITDSTNVHKGWLVGHQYLDYFITIDDDTKLALMKAGIEEDKIKVFGFPVAPELFMPFDKKSFLEKFNMTDSLLTILLVIGLGDTNKLLEIIECLRTYPKSNFQLIVITGKYKKYYDYLSRRKYTMPTKIIGWTNEMHNFIRSSDMVIAKCGGAIFTETISGGIPLFIPVFTPGQEEGNAQMIKKYKMGIVEPSTKKFIAELKKIIEKPEILNEFKKGVERYRKHNPAEKIIKFIYSISSIAQSK